MKKVRMADIAEKLNISVVTVSKALSGQSGVSESMRSKVIALAKQMGYASTKVAEKAPEEFSIGVLVSDRFFSENTFYTNLYRSLLIGSEKEHLICTLEIVTREAEKNVVLPKLILGQKVDGIIFMGNLSKSYLHAVISTGLPCVLLDFYMENENQSCVISDNLNGGYALTQHLLTTGYQDIGFVGSIFATSSIMDRYLGYQKALRMAGIAPNENWLLADRDEEGEFLAVTLPDPLPQAFICSCDETAYKLVETLRQNGLRVPEDVAVCGYDDFRFATLSHPQLTTYRVDTERMASLALELIARILQSGQTESLTYVVSGHPVIRESSSTSKA